MGDWTTFLNDKTGTECNPYKCKFSEEPGCCDDTCDYDYKLGSNLLEVKDSAPF